MVKESQISLEQNKVKNPHLQNLCNQRNLWLKNLLLCFLNDIIRRRHQLEAGLFPHIWKNIRRSNCIYYEPLSKTLRIVQKTCRTYRIRCS